MTCNVYLIVILLTRNSFLQFTMVPLFYFIKIYRVTCEKFQKNYILSLCFFLLCLWENIHLRVYTTYNIKPLALHFFFSLLFVSLYVMTLALIAIVDKILLTYASSLSSHFCAFVNIYYIYVYNWRGFLLFALLLC